MESFSNWLKIRESSPSTRLKRQIAFGLAPPTADIFGHSTPAPWEIKRLKKALKKSKKKKKKVNESKTHPINHNFDSFIKSVEALAKDLWELELLKKKKETQEKMDKIKKSKIPDKETEKIKKPKVPDKTAETKVAGDKEENDKVDKSNQKSKKPTSKE